MAIQKSQRLFSVDGLTVVYMEGPIGTFPTADDFTELSKSDTKLRSNNISIIYDDGSGLIRLYWITSRGNVAYTNLGTENYGPTASGLVDKDGDTMVTVELNPDEDIVRQFTGDTQGGESGERTTTDYQGFHVTEGLKVGFRGREGDTYAKYNANSAYLEHWVDGQKRLEM